MKVLYDFSNAVEHISSKVKEDVDSFSKRMVIAIAGTSASGKSYFAKMLSNALKSQGLKSFYINADNFYKKETPLYASFYESFDHKETIDLRELALIVNQAKEKSQDTITLPIYSFEKATRVGYEKYSLNDVDVIIVDGIYVINALEQVADFLIYVKSSSPVVEIMRRFIRDSEGERLRLAPDYVLKLLVGAYVMFELFGKEQEEKSNYIIINDYDVLANNSFNWEKAKVLSLEEFETRLKEKGLWYFYEDEEGIELVIHEQVNQKITMFMKTPKGVLSYVFDSGKEFMLIHLLAKVIGLSLYKIKEL